MPVLRLSMLLQIFSLQKDVIPCKPVNYKGGPWEKIPEEYVSAYGNLEFEVN